MQKAIVTGVLINAGSDIYLDVSPALDPLSSDRNYRGKEIEVSVSHLEYVEKPVYLVSNQYKYRRSDGTLARVDKHIAFLPRETITVDVDGGYTEADRTNATEIKAGTTSLVGRKVITTNKVVDITSGKLGENEGYAKDLFGTIHGDSIFFICWFNNKERDNGVIQR